MIDCKALISAVRDLPCLWLHSDSDYMNKDVRDGAWEEVAKAVFPDWDQRADRYAKCCEVKRKWANIRDSYRKEFHRCKRMGKTETGRPKKEYIFADMLTFLRPVLKRRRSLLFSDNSQMSGDAVVESTEGSAPSAEDSLQSQPPTLSKKTRADPGVNVPVVWVRSLQEHAPAHIVATSSLLSTSVISSRNRTESNDRGGGVGPRQNQQQQKPPARPSTSVLRTNTASPAETMSPPPPPAHAPSFQPPPAPPQPSYQQLPQYHPGSMVVREQDSDLSFLYSFLPDMRSMSELQKMDFKIGMMNLMKEIRFPEAPPSGFGSRAQIQHQQTHSSGQGPSGSGQDFSRSPRSGVIYVTADASHEFEAEEGSCDSEFPATVKTE